MTTTIENYSRNNPAQVWRIYKYDLSRSADMARYVARERYACLCHDCCKSEYSLIAHSTPGDGWHVAAIDHAANMDDSEWCSHCGREIKSAYDND